MKTILDDLSETFNSFYHPDVDVTSAWEDIGGGGYTMYPGILDHHRFRQQKMDEVGVVYDMNNSVDRAIYKLKEKLAALSNHK